MSNITNTMFLFRVYFFYVKTDYCFNFMSNNFLLALSFASNNHHLGSTAIPVASLSMHRNEITVYQ